MNYVTDGSIEARVRIRQLLTIQGEQLADHRLRLNPVAYEALEEYVHGKNIDLAEALCDGMERPLDQLIVRGSTLSCFVANWKP